mgnify:CR=1 FL=1
MEEVTDKPEKQTDSTVSAQQVVSMVWARFGDTTWRLFVPSVGGCILGVWADNSWGTASLTQSFNENGPLMIIIGTALGISCAIWLVVLQYRKVKGTK